MRTLTQIVTQPYNAAEPPTVTLGTSSANVLAAPTAPAVRTRLRIQNGHASNTIYLREDGGVASASAGGWHLKIGPGQMWDWEDRVPQGLITGIADGAGTVLGVLHEEV